MTLYIKMVKENGEDRRSSTSVLWYTVNPILLDELHVLIEHARIDRICGSSENRQKCHKGLGYKFKLGGRCADVPWVT